MKDDTPLSINQQIVFLKTMSDSDKIPKMTWEDIAEAVGLENGEQARGRYRIEEAKNPQGLTKVNENNLVLNTLGPDRVISANDLLETHGIDTEVWEVARQSLRKWDGYSKISHKDLKWKDGKIQDGYIKSEGKINLVELYYVRIELVRKEPIQLKPLLPQVNIEIPEGFEIRKTNGPKLAQHFVVYIPDAHFPYQNEKALGLVLQWVKDHHKFISHIIWGGDVLDLKELSRFTDLENNAPSLQKALVSAGTWLLAFKMAAPQAKHVYLEGNHEKRLRIQLADKLPALYGLKQFRSKTNWPLISIPMLLNLQEMDIIYVEDYPEGVYTVNDVHYAHGTFAGKNGLGLAKALRETDFNLVVGHDHRIQVGTKRVWISPTKSKTIQVTLGGWMGDPNNPPPPGKIRNDWTNGFVITTNYYENHRTEAIEITDDGFFWGGDFYTPQDISA